MPVWFIDGKAYDLTEFMPKHPGGAQYLAFAGNDVSITFWSYHRDPKKNMKGSRVCIIYSICSLEILSTHLWNPPPAFLGL